MLNPGGNSVSNVKLSVGLMAEQPEAAIAPATANNQSIHPEKVASDTSTSPTL
jgi:hypothetical protein